MSRLINLNSGEKISINLSLEEDFSASSSLVREPGQVYLHFWERRNFLLKSVASIVVLRKIHFLSSASWANYVGSATKYSLHSKC